MDDPYDLDRYLRAQEPLYQRVRAELVAGCKQTHWMWFIFPQLRGLGSSATAERFGIGSLGEARAYLAHELLGARLRECTRLVNGVRGRRAQAIFGYPDELKFRSCMTLFAYAAEEHPAGAGDDPEGAGAARADDRIFREALARFFAGEEDPLTRERLRAC